QPVETERAQRRPKAHERARDAAVGPSWARAGWSGDIFIFCTSRPERGPLELRRGAPLPAAPGAQQEAGEERPQAADLGDDEADHAPGGAEVALAELVVGAVLEAEGDVRRDRDREEEERPADGGDVHRVRERAVLDHAGEEESGEGIEQRRAV